MIHDLDARLARQRAFWRSENHGPAVLGFTGTCFSTDMIGSIRSGREDRPDDIETEGYLDYCDSRHETWQGCTGDLFRTANPLHQFRWLEAVAGAPVFADGDSIWADPGVLDYDNLDCLTISSDKPWLRKLWALTDRLVARAVGRYPSAANEFMSPLGAPAELRGNRQLVFDLYDYPETSGRVRRRSPSSGRRWSPRRTGASLPGMVATPVRCATSGRPVTWPSSARTRPLCSHPASTRLS